ncbi:GNAT family N-acetyltransferase, partial [Streptomyces beijiangensis]
IRIADATREGRFHPAEHLANAAEGLLAELVRVSHALAPLRERECASAVAGPVVGSYARRLVQDDAPEVTVLQRCCWTEEAVANGTLDVPALHESPDQVRAWLADWQTTGLWRDGRLLGMVRTRRSGADLHVGRLAVVPDLRGLGLGRWLLRTAEAAGEGCSRIVLSTGAASTRNLALYQGQGYGPVPTSTD